jgi:hypothetical protein
VHIQGDYDPEHRGTVPRFTVFFVVLLFACGLCDKVSDVELSSSSWAFISIACIFFQNTVGQALDSREVVRIRCRTSVLSGLVIQFIGVGQKGAFALRSSGTTLRCLAWSDVDDSAVLLMVSLWFLVTSGPAHRASRRGSRGRHLGLSLVGTSLGT